MCSEACPMDTAVAAAAAAAAVVAVVKLASCIPFVIITVLTCACRASAINGGGQPGSLQTAAPSARPTPRSNKWWS